MGDDAYNGIFAFGIVFVDSLLCTLVSSNRDILYEAVHINFEVGVPALGVDGIGVGVAAVVRVETVCAFPFIGHAVAIGIVAEQAALAFKFGVAGKCFVLLTLRVVDKVELSGLLGDRTCIGGYASASLDDIARIDEVAIEAGSTEREYLAESRLCIVGGDIASGAGLVEFDLHIVDTIFLSVGDIAAVHVVGILAVAFAIDEGSTTVVLDTLPVVVSSLVACG